MFNFSTPGSYVSPLRWGSHEYELMKGVADSTDLLKSTGMQAGEGIVQGYGFGYTAPGQVGNFGGNALNTAPDASNLRVQFMHGVLEQVSFEQDDAMAMKLIPKEKVYSNTFEWTQFQQYGGPGDGFSVENGFDQASNGTGAGSLFGVNQSDDNFIRQVLQIKYMVATRTISLPETLVRNIANPESTAEKGATLELIAKANLSIYWGDSKKAVNQFNGLVRQMVDYLINNNANDYSILYDAGGNPIDKYMLEDIAAINRNKFGKGDLLLLSTQAFGDAQKSLFPQARFNEGDTAQGFGNLRKDFLSLYGNIHLEYDPMLRVNQPLVVEGAGADGRPLTAGSAGASVTWNTASISSQVTATQAAPAGTNPFYLNTTIAGAVPANSGPVLPTGDGNQSNRLAAGNYWYALSIVSGGLESAPYICGASAVSNFSGITQVTVAAGNIVTISINTANVGSGSISALTAAGYKIRVYRYGGPGAAAPTALSQFNFLCDSGVIAGTTLIYDNGMYMAGTDNGFLITSKKNGANGWFLAQLLPLMRRKGLPSFVMGDVLAMLMFVAPVLLVPRHHIYIRNIGRAS